MQLINRRILPLPNLGLWLAFAIAVMPALLSCSDKPESAENASVQEMTDSFTFFGLGRTTKLTDGVRDDLSSELGRDAIERRSILDLEINYRGFLAKHFPQIDGLNRKLNSPLGERVEHNTVKLMYRYAQKKNMPFNLVELVFSGYTKTPILFKINLKADGANTVETLKQKYGQPETVDWKEGEGKSLYWMKSGDVMIVSLIPDQFGNIEYRIIIYFIGSLKDLIAAESREKQELEQQRAKTVKEAF